MARFLAIILPDRVWWSTIAHGLRVPRNQAAVSKARGTKPGVPDILVIHEGRALWMELKRPGAYPTQAQRRCHDAIRRAGGIVAIIRSLEDAETFLRTEGVPTESAS